MTQIQEAYSLPRRFTRDEIALVPFSWTRIISDYPMFRKRAFNEVKPDFCTLVAMISVAIVRNDRGIIDFAVALTKANVPEHVCLSIAGSALSALGFEDEGIIMQRDAVKLRPSDVSVLLGLAAETNDLDEKEDLAKRVLSGNPQDNDALRHLAYAKYFKGNVEEAKQLLDKILLTEANNVHALVQKGNIYYFNEHEYRKALEAYLKIKLKPVPVSLLFKICHCYYMLGKIRKAKRIARKVKDKVVLNLELKPRIEEVNKILDEILSCKSSWLNRAK
jgi:tetratricopeptide (TPR) repeat protein